MNAEFAREFVNYLFPNCGISSVQPFAFDIDNGTLLGTSEHPLYFNGSCVYVGYVSKKNHIRKVIDNVTLFEDSKDFNLVLNGRVFSPSLSSPSLLIFDDFCQIVDFDTLGFTFTGFKVNFLSRRSDFVYFSTVSRLFSFVVFKVGTTRNMFSLDDDFNIDVYFGGKVFASDGVFTVLPYNMYGGSIGLSDIGNNEYMSYQYFEGIKGLHLPKTADVPIVDNFVSSAAGYSFDLHDLTNYGIDLYPTGGGASVHVGSAGLAGVHTISSTWDLFFAGSSRPSGWDFNNPFANVLLGSGSFSYDGKSYNINYLSFNLKNS